MSVAHRIELVKQAFGIQSHSDWASVAPEDVLSVHDVGPATLDHVRIYLAARGLTLRDDQTPEFWQKHLSATKIGHQMGASDKATSSPITILVDTGEQLPWTFQGIRGQGGIPLVVPFVRRALGPSWGDYSIRGWEGSCHVERKSVSDCVGTVLSHGTDRHEAFKRTVENLSSIECAAIIVEGSMGDCIAAVRGNDGRDAPTRARQFFCQLLAWQTDYSVPWIFAADRRMAEVACYRIMDRFWRHKMSELRRRPAMAIESRGMTEDIDRVLGEL